MKYLAKHNLVLIIVSLVLSSIATLVAINVTSSYLIYTNYMKSILFISNSVCFFCLVKIFFTRYNTLYKYLFFIAYCGYIYVFLFCRGADNAVSGVNLKLFAYDELNLDDPFVFKQNLFNTLLFLPLGCIYFKSRLKDFGFVLIFFVICLGVEFLQNKLQVGVFDITDILFYLLGFFVGRIIRNIYLRVIKFKH